MPEFSETLERVLRGIQDQLHALEDENNTRHLLEALQRQPDDHALELTGYLHRIENLIQTLLDHGHPRDPELPLQHPSPSRSVSISDSIAGPSMAQQQDEILSAARQTTPSDLPYVQPFIYPPPDYGDARSLSPISEEFTPPLVFPVHVASAVRPRRESPEPEVRGETTVNTRATEQDYRDVPGQEPEGIHIRPGPPPKSVFVSFGLLFWNSIDRVLSPLQGP
jgi:hypothetical protein